MRTRLSFAVLAFVTVAGLWAAGGTTAAPLEQQTILDVLEATPAKATKASGCTFTIQRSGDLARTSRVEYDTDSGTAKEDRHFVRAAGFVEFASDETTKTIVVDVIKQKFRFSSFTLRIFNPSANSNIGDEEGFCVLRRR
jgi:hypothetical protein